MRPSRARIEHQSRDGRRRCRGRPVRCTGGFHGVRPLFRHVRNHALEDFRRTLLLEVLERMGDVVQAEVAAYCDRLNKMVSAVLVNAGPADTTGETSAEEFAAAIQPVRPGMRRR